MIFGQEMIDKILAGEKIVTRRPVKLAKTTNEPTLYRECRYKPGRTYAVQPRIEEGPGKGRGGKEVGRIRVLEVRREPLHNLTLSDSWREGFPDTMEFHRYWLRLHGTYSGEQLVDRIEFELLEHEAFHAPSPKPEHLRGEGQQ